ncbi:hypothetical protein ABXT06_14800 [Flavobacterium sp. UW10123]|uniref:hypothetical protein n=1 Tax=Flavobacterium sp. UW10123 TaxID=3230800 RepID=UPI003394D79D
MTLADLIKDFIDSTKERLKNPISGAFLWSFVFYNWRPICLLLFSKTSIENKIIVINHEYCSFWAIFFPIVIATFYTLLIPKIMLEIDKDLEPTKDARITKRYASKKHEVVEKTKVAKAEFLLKSEESGTQTIQEFMSQIEALKENNNNLQDSIKQINESNKVTVDGLNHSLQIAKQALNEKEQQNVILKRINDLKKDNAPDIHIQDDDTISYRFLIKGLINKAQLSEIETTQLLKITDNLNAAQFDSIESLEKNSHGMVILSKVKDYTNVQVLLDRGVLQRRVAGNRLSYHFTNEGKIIHNLLKNSSNTNS